MTMATLDGLMQGDAAASDNKILDNAWKGVEAMELFITAHDKLYAGQVRLADAIKTRSAGLSAEL